MSSTGTVCDSLGKTSLTSLVGYYWATDGLWVNFSPVKGEFIIFPLFLLEENSILPMTARGGCPPPPRPPPPTPYNVMHSHFLANSHLWHQKSHKHHFFVTPPPPPSLAHKVIKGQPLRSYTIDDTPTGDWRKQIACDI